MPSARDSGEAHAVERRASGAAAAFDGNHTGNLVSWLFPNDQWGVVENTDDMLDELMFYTARGHLQWCVFPPAGYRL